MNHELSPAVERAALAVRALASNDTVRYAHWMIGLLLEDEGRTAVLLERMEVPLQPIRDALTAHMELSAVAAATHTLFEAAREYSLHLRGDPEFTTDVLFLAVFASDTELHSQLEPFGLNLSKLESQLSTLQRATHDSDLESASFIVADHRDYVEAARVLDANLNRSREALRVLDDHARFILNDRFLTEQFKTLRHELVRATQLLPASLLLSSRDTLHDTGTSLTAGTEYERNTPANVAQINLKRLQESLRSLEEYGKIINVDFARIVEKTRYATYTLERAVVRGTNARERLLNSKLYLLLTGSLCEAALDWTIAEAAMGGVDVVQMREKNQTDRELLERAQQMRKWTRAADVLFIVNDRPDIAKLCEADGVHLGQDDLSVQAARKILGPDALIGVSTHDVEQIRRAVLDGADYIGIGPTFPSQTKNFDHFPGLAFVREASEETSQPTFALGGITSENIAEVLAAGATRVAVSSAIAQSDDPRSAAMQLRLALDAARAS